MKIPSILKLILVAILAGFSTAFIGFVFGIGFMVILQTNDWGYPRILSAIGLGIGVIISFYYVWKHQETFWNVLA